MTDQHALADEGARTRLPIWLQCMVALVGTVLLAGPVVAVVWYH